MESVFGTLNVFKEIGAVSWVMVLVAVVDAL